LFLSNFFQTSNLRLKILKALTFGLDLLRDALQFCPVGVAHRFVEKSGCNEAVDDSSS